MAYRMRFTIPDDVPACVAMEPTHFGCPDECQCATWLKELLKTGRALSAVVVNEADEPAAFGLTLFISDRLRQTLLERRNLLIGTSLQQFSNHILGLPQIVQGHRGNGLNMVGFYGWRDELPGADLAAVQSLLYDSFAYLHAGYHLKSFLKEVYGTPEAQRYAQMGFTCHKEPSHYLMSSPLPVEPYLMGLVRGVVFPARGADLFRAAAPNIRLKRRVREVVQLAYRLRLDDREIAGCLQTSEHALHNIWHRLGQGLNGNGGCNNSRSGRRGCLRVIAQSPEIIYPLSVHTLFYREPELARRYPLPLHASAVVVAPVRRANLGQVPGQDSPAAGVQA